MRSIPFLNLGKLHSAHREEIYDAMQKVVDASAFIGGNEKQLFEKAFAAWVGGNVEAVGCGNGTDAISIAARAMKLPDGSEAVIPAMTFIATPEALIQAGIQPKLVDVQPDTWVMDPKLVAAAVTAQTKLIVPVHLYGQMAPMDEIQTIAKSKGCLTLEDSAQAHGATWKGNPVGHYGDLATFSFFPGKNLGAFGDAGAIVGRNIEMVTYARALASHGGLKKYQHDYVGYNSRLDNLQAAVLNVKLKYLTTWNEARQRIAKFYGEGLSGLNGLALPKVNPDAVSVYHLYVVVVEKRNEFMEFLTRKGVATGVHYPKAIHQLPAFRGVYDGQSFPNAERVAAHGVSLPMCPTLEPADLDYVIKTVREYFGK